MFSKHGTCTQSHRQPQEPTRNNQRIRFKGQTPETQQMRAHVVLWGPENQDAVKSNSVSAVYAAATHSHLFPRENHCSLQRCIVLRTSYSTVPKRHPLCQPGHGSATGDKSSLQLIKVESAVAGLALMRVGTSLVFCSSNSEEILADKTETTVPKASQEVVLIQY